MKGEWCYWKGYFSPEVCNNILDMGLKLKEQDGVVGNSFKGGSVGEVVNEARRSKVRFISQYDRQFEFLFDTVWKLALQSNLKWFDFHINKLEAIQLAEYDASYLGEYKEHVDVFWVNPTNPHSQRKLSAIIQLTDPSEYDGGDLEFIGVDQHPKARDLRHQGTVTFFPSFVRHRATPVTRGRRHSLACWFEGPNFR